MQDFKETQEYTKSQHNATINTLIHAKTKIVRTHYLPMFNNKTSNVANNQFYSMLTNKKHITLTLFYYVKLTWYCYCNKLNGCYSFNSKQKH